MKFTTQISAAIVAPLLASQVLAGCPPQCQGMKLQKSCHNTTAITNTCCNEYPGGQILQTQFWDTNPASGPAQHWTVHGLWPDYCDGTYPQYCDESRQYTNITQILESYNQTDLLTYMRKYWTDYHGNEESFWEHEFGKHATCMSTLDPSCYSNYQPTEEVVDFFRRTVDMFKRLTTYHFLAEANIVPTTTANYTYEAVMAALAKPRGVNATIQCSNGQLDEVWYTYDIVGSIQSGKFVPANPVGETSSCPESFQYLPKNLSSTYPTSSVISSAMPTATLDQSCRIAYS